MKTAKELWTITDNVIQEKIAKRRAKAQSTLERAIVPQMEAAAAEGDHRISFYVDADVDIDVIVAELELAEYTVKKAGRTLHIDWFWKK